MEMHWFDGPIPNAIEEAKSKRALFLVYISGPDGDSKEMDERWNEESVITACTDANCVALKVEQNSETCKQFSEFYPVVCVPSTFLISSATGMPLEIIGGKVEAEELSSMVKRVSKDFKESRDGQQMALGEQSTSSGGCPPKQDGGSPTSETSPEDLEARVQRARELVAEKQAQRMREAQEKERSDEMTRREAMKNLQVLKERQKLEEMKKHADERKKEKEQDRLAKERIKRQIAEDRAERAKKFAADKQAVEAEQAERRQRKEAESQRAAEQRLAQNSSVARIQFRLPDGSFINQQFDPDASLGEAYDFVANEMSVRGVGLGLRQGFGMSTTYPRRKFNSADMGSSLRELGLAPSAVLLLLPLQEPDRRSTGGEVASAGITGIVWMIISPLLYIFSALKAFLLGSGGAPTTTGASRGEGGGEPHDSDDDVPLADGARPRPDRPRSAVGARGPGGTVTRRGNVARLHNLVDDDDENATWNGNSTQQM